MSALSDREVQFTQQAIAQMTAQSVPPDAVAQAVVENAPTATTGSGNEVYAAEVGDRHITAVVAEGSSPPTVMAVVVSAS